MLFRSLNVEEVLWNVARTASRCTSVGKEGAKNAKQCWQTKINDFLYLRQALTSRKDGI